MERKECIERTSWLLFENHRKSRIWMSKMFHFGKFLEAEACGQTVLLDKSLKVKTSAATIWVIFKQCDLEYLITVHSTSCFMHVEPVKHQMCMIQIWWIWLLMKDNLMLLTDDGRPI